MQILYNCPCPCEAFCVTFLSCFSASLFFFLILFSLSFSFLFLLTVALVDTLMPISACSQAVSIMQLIKKSVRDKAVIGRQHNSQEAGLGGSLMAPGENHEEKSGVI